MQLIKGMPATIEEDLRVIQEAIEGLSVSEKRMIMLITGGPSEMKTDEYLRNVFIWAILTRTSDIHLQYRQMAAGKKFTFNLRTGNGFARIVINEGASEFADRVKAKLFALTNTPSGALSSPMNSTRFSMALPKNITEPYGLEPIEQHYGIGVRAEYQKTEDGYAFTCRILDDQKAPQIHDLKMPVILLKSVLRLIEQPSGLILVSGPTGSGKSTLLNAMLRYRNDGNTAIHTIERPVEYTIRGDGPIKQVGVVGEITFANALRSSLRQDPDIILIGEINDQTTMEIALQAAQTGHLVFATIHANNAPETISRAIDLTQDKKRDAYRLGTTLRMVISQRLINSYEGEVAERQLNRYEREWLKTNGMGHLKTIRDIQSKDARKVGKVPVLEVIRITDSIKNRIRSDNLDIVSIFNEAKEQDEYESLSMAGVRAAEQYGGKLEDVMMLDSNSEAEKNIPKRCRYSAEHGLSMLQVSDCIDQYSEMLDSSQSANLQGILEGAKSTERAEA